MIKKLILILSLFLLVIDTNAQFGIFFQAVARDNFNNPAKDRKIFVQSNIIQTSPSGKIVLTEEHQTLTDVSGVFNIMVGNGVRVGGTVASLNAIDWSNHPYYLNIKIAITPIGASNTWDYSKEWIDIGTSIFGAVPYALYSTNTSQINDKLNSIDTTKMLSGYVKEKAIQTLTTIVDAKLATKDTSAMLKTYARIKYTDSALLTKLMLKDTIKYTKQSYTDSTFLTKLNAADTIKYTKQLYTDAALLRKMNIEDTLNYTKQTYTDSALQTKLLLTDTIKYTKLIYIDSALLTKLSLTGNALTATIADNITATYNTTLTSLSNLKTVGTITTGIWSATTIDIANGGTGLKTAGLSGQALTTSAAGTLTWTNVSELTGAHYIGESFGGGIVFYVHDNGKHGLIVSTEDQGVEVKWYNGTYSTTNAFRDGVNAGLLNTERIILSQGSGNYAAQIAASYKGGGYGDWYLPSAYELGLLHIQRALFFTGSNVIYYYYSSNENPSNNKQVMCYRFTPTIYNTYLDKLNTLRVRAIRAF